MAKIEKIFIDSKPFTKVLNGDKLSLIAGHDATDKQINQVLKSVG